MDYDDVDYDEEQLHETGYPADDQDDQDDDQEDRGRYQSGYRVYRDGSYREDFGGDQ